MRYEREDKRGKGLPKESKLKELDRETSPPYDTIVLTLLLIALCANIIALIAQIY